MSSNDVELTIAQKESTSQVSSESERETRPLEEVKVDPNDTLKFAPHKKKRTSNDSDIPLHESESKWVEDEDTKEVKEVLFK